MAYKYNHNLQGEKAKMDKNSTIIYYNSKCSKCRASLELLNNKGTKPKVIEYLNNTPSKSELKDLISKLGITADQLLRKKESQYQESGLSESSSEEQILDAMVKYPILIERPIVIHNDKATIGRPPENILDIL